MRQQRLERRHLAGLQHNLNPSPNPSDASSAHEQGDDKQHQEQDEQDLRYPRCGASYAAKPQDSGYQRDHQKCNSPTQHNFFSFFRCFLFT
jgi:hypothetical protein